MTDKCDHVFRSKQTVEIKINLQSQHTYLRLEVVNVAPEPK